MTFVPIKSKNSPSGAYADIFVLSASVLERLAIL
jgi:hypothetical protein